MDLADMVVDGKQLGATKKRIKGFIQTLNTDCCLVILLVVSGGLYSRRQDGAELCQAQAQQS